MFVHAHSRLVISEDSEAGGAPGTVKNTISDLTQSIMPEIPLWQFYMHR